MTIQETTLDLIARHEGFSPIPYKDTVGKLTVGFGHNLYNPMSQAKARVLLEDDIRDAIRDLITVFPALWSFGENRANALIDMCFNLGINKFNGFGNMIAAVNRGDWKLASQEAENSMWFTQVGNRGKEDVKMLREG